MRVLSKRFSAGIVDHCSVSANHRHHPREVATRGVLAKYPSNAPDLTGTTDDFSIDNRGHLLDNDLNRLTVGVAGRMIEKEIQAIGAVCLTKDTTRRRTRSMTTAGSGWLRSSLPRDLETS